MARPGCWCLPDGCGGCGGCEGAARLKPLNFPDILNLVQRQYGLFQFMPSPVLGHCLKLGLSKTWSWRSPPQLPATWGQTYPDIYSARHRRSREIYTYKPILPSLNNFAQSLRRNRGLVVGMSLSTHVVQQFSQSSTPPQTRVS